MRQNLPIISPFSLTTRFLHWIVALFMIGLLGVGIYMTETGAYHLYPIHKSVGVIALVFIVLRVLWRISKGWPIPVKTYHPHEQILAKLVHWLLIIGTLLMPISGVLMSGMGGFGVYVFGIEIMPINRDVTSQKIIPVDADLASLGKSIHGIAAKVLIACIVLHILGAFKHHFIDKDNTLRRMLGLRLK